MRLSVPRITMRAAMMSQKMLSAVMPPARRHSKKIRTRPARMARRDQNFRRRGFMVICGDLSCLDRERERMGLGQMYGARIDELSADLCGHGGRGGFALAAYTARGSRTDLRERV